MTVIFVTFLFSACGTTAPHEYSGFVMDTYAQFKVWGGDAKALFSTAQELDKLYSMYSLDSEISKINENSGEVSVSADTLSIIEQSITLNEEFGDGVNITVGGLTLLWNVTSDNPIIPQKGEIEAELSKLAKSNMIVSHEDETVTLSAGKLDLGAVAKGYACDKIKAQLDGTDVKCAIVTFGSSSLLYGQKPDQKPFVVAVKNPDVNSGILGELELSEGFISTSGGYERFFEIDGELYHHILDVKTGYPVNTDLTSVTVICDSGIKSDFLSTLIFIGGTKELDKHLDSDGYYVIAVTDDKKIYMSDELKDSFMLMSNDFTVM